MFFMSLMSRSLFDIFASISMVWVKTGVGGLEEEGSGDYIRFGNGVLEDNIFGLDLLMICGGAWGGSCMMIMTTMC